jgi:hypothetical protein
MAELIVLLFAINVRVKYNNEDKFNRSLINMSENLLSLN